jgi:hypothetical protein
MTRCMNGCKHPYAKRMKKRRQSTVEPVLGTLINFMGIRRIWTRGLTECKQVYAGCSHCLQPEEVVELHRTKKKNSCLNATASSHKKAIFIVPDVSFSIRSEKIASLPILIWCCTKKSLSKY